MTKKEILTLLLDILIVSCMISVSQVSTAEVGENSWKLKAPMLIEREEFGVAVVDRQIYAVGGWNENEMYNLSANNWTGLALLPTGRADPGVAVYQDKIYVIGGENASYSIRGPDFADYEISGVTGINEVYDPATNMWETKAPMPTPRNYLQANVVEGKIYLIGGLTQQEQAFPLTEHSSNLNEVYDPVTDSWATAASIPTAVWGYSSAVIDDKIYVISGWSGNSSSRWGQSASLIDLVQIFDPKTNSWTVGKPLPTPVVLAAAGATTGVMAPKRIYVIGGCPTVNTQGQGGINATQVYDPKTDTWSRGADVPTKRRGLAVAVVNDVLYALGGSDRSLTNANEQYIPIGYGTLEPTPTPTVMPTNQLSTVKIATAVAVAVAVAVGAGIIVYLKKRSH
jgi:N-acetylneuraminic acid mutarotase